MIQSCKKTLKYVCLILMSRRFLNIIHGFFNFWVREPVAGGPSNPGEPHLPGNARPNLAPAQKRALQGPKTGPVGDKICKTIGDSVGIFGLIIGLLMVQNCLKWSIDAQKWFPRLRSTFLAIITFRRNLGLWLPYLLQKYF